MRDDKVFSTYCKQGSIMKTFRKFCRNILLAVCIPYSSLGNPPPGPVAITHDTHGRFGNQLMTYLGAKWVSQKYHLPLLYTPFEYSEHFIFHEQETNLASEWESSYQNQICLKNMNDIKNIPEFTLITFNIFHTNQSDSNWAKIPLTAFWKDPEFLKLCHELLKPRHPVNVLELPKDKITVAVHVRTGGGFDSLNVQRKFPLKFPPMEFYKKALERLSHTFKHGQLYAYVMTDDLEPANIVEYLKTNLSHIPNIEFDFREKHSGPDMDVLEDFFSIPKFDCLIRPKSTFSMAASLLGNFKIILFPTHRGMGKTMQERDYFIFENESL
jgi:hypothetical protein